MKPDPRHRSTAAVALWGTLYALARAAYAEDPFTTLAAHTIILTITIAVLYSIDGMIDRRAQKKERTWQSN